MDSPHSQSLPSGVVTFLLTDIESSTRLWEREPDAMREALERHDAIVNDEVPRVRGHVVKSKGEGDSVFSVFACEADAVSATIALQRTFEAFELAEQLEAEALHSDERARPEIVMAARAARSADLAVKVGDEVNRHVVDCAAEAIRIALRMTRLDLPSLAQQAVR